MATRINVKRLREAHGESQRTFAKRLWPDAQPSELAHRERTVSRWENGHTSPSPMARHKLQQLHDEAKQKSVQAVSGPARVDVDPQARFT